jgi:hypothetical protein
MPNPIGTRDDYELPHDGVCPSCGAPLEVATAPPPHHAQAVCIDCGFGGEPVHRGWLRDPLKPDAGRARRDHNTAWRSHHTDPDGGVTCAWCLASSRDKQCAFDVDHIVPLGPPHGGIDELSNTRILCADCHQKRHADVRAVEHLLRSPI